MALPDDQKYQVQQATDLVALVGEAIALRPKGKELVGLCPFHADKNPSMYVSRDKQIFKCFVCGSGGDVFSWMMKYHKMAFPEALKYLAERAGIKLQWSEGRGQQSEGQGPSERELIAEANDRATGFFRAMLRHEAHGRAARQYVEQRGINAPMVDAFAIGYAPDRWDGLALTLAAKGWSKHGFELAGLLSPRKGGDGHYDRLRHRLIFPIFDALKRPIAFGGRVLPGATHAQGGDPASGGADAKYLNSPESVLFNKSATLYGIHLAKKPIIDSRTAVIVEGYTDVIACHQAGVCNVVATLGTALTAQHVHELRKYAEKVVLIFDADDAGQKAADRAVEVFLNEELDVQVAVLPDGLDPADLFAQPDGLARWIAALKAATDALDYQFQRMHARFDAADTLTGRQRLAEAYLRRLAELGLGRAGVDVIRESMIVQRLCGMLHLSEDAVRTLLQRYRPHGPADDANSMPRNAENPAQISAESTLEDDGAGAKIRGLRIAERQFIGGLLRRPNLLHLPLADGRSLAIAVTPVDLVTASGKRLYQMIHDHLSQGQDLTLTGLLADLADAGDLGLADWATSVEDEAEQAAAGRDDRLQAMLVGAVEALDAHRQECACHDARQALLTATDQQQDGNESDEAKLLRQIADHRRANPSPARIGRV